VPLGFLHPAVPIASSVKRHGYIKDLLVLPFDHRNSFQEKLFQIYGAPNAEQTALVASYKMMIYEGFEMAVRSGLPKDKMGILTDEQFGDNVLKKAKASGYTICLCCEKSGQDEFDFEYGKNYQAHIQKYSPDCVKVLVRYNPEGDKAMNARQAEKLADLSHYLEGTKHAFMFELLVPPTEKQLAACGGNKATFDLEMRPGLMVKAIEELQDAGIEADIWKLEGLEKKADFERVCNTARREGRDDVGCIVLGRGENEAKVREWLSVGANVRGVVGFAVGRTVFWEPLKQFRENKISREDAVKKIAQTYSNLCKLWLQSRD
jgi:5-dehydro-2-deoxygluconokinase